jgi:iron complex outermembrane receptor protein
MFFDQGYVGASLSTQGMSYGTVAEDEVRIGMQSSRFRLEGELKDFRHTKMAGGWLQGLKMQFTRNQYQHTEFESEVPKTVFDSAGHEFRLEARHRKTGGWEGVLGLQLESNDFSAFGDEAFMPVTQTRSQALFVHEEYPTQWGRWSAGARAEQVQVASLGHPTLTQFQAASRSFTPQSYALGALWRVAPDWQLTTNLTWNERAPKDYELFANGTHVATNTIEIGRSNLGKEKSSNLDVGAAWKRGAHLAQVQAFVHEFSNFISLELSDASTSPYPTYTYTPVQARLTGLEASGNLRLLGFSQEQESGVWTHTRGTLDLGARADTVRADNTSTGQALPRVAPMRVGAHLRWTQGPWSSRLGVDQVSAQDRVPTGQLATPGYQMWNAALTFREKRGATQLQWFARLDNMSDVLAYSATSILTQTAPGKAPLPGRSVRLGLQVSF